MMILRMKGVALSIAALLLLFVSSCSQPSAPVASGDKSFGVTDPPGPPSNAAAKINLTTPTLTGTQDGPGQIKLTWFASGRTDGSEAPGGEYYPSSGEYNTGATDVVDPGSGHTDLFMWDAALGQWAELPSQTDNEHTVSGLADGTYFFYAKEKSMYKLRGTDNATFHSWPSAICTVTVSSCQVQYNVSSITAPGWIYNRGVNPNYAPTFNNDGEYVSGNYQVVVCAGLTTGTVSLNFGLAATCNGTANGRNDVTGQVYDDVTPVGAPVTATWNGTDYVLTNLTYPSLVGSWSIKIKVGGVDVMTPIELNSTSNETWTVTAGSIPSGTVNLTTNALTRKTHQGNDFNFTFTLAADASNCSQSITGRTIRMNVNNPNDPNDQTTPSQTAAEPDPINTPGTYKFVGNKGVSYGIVTPISTNPTVYPTLTVTFEILNPVTNSYEPIESGWTIQPTP